MLMMLLVLLFGVSACGAHPFEYWTLEGCIKHGFVTEDTCLATGVCPKHTLENCKDHITNETCKPHVNAETCEQFTRVWTYGIVDWTKLLFDAIKQFGSFLHSSISCLGVREVGGLIIISSFYVCYCSLRRGLRADDIYQNLLDNYKKDDTYAQALREYNEAVARYNKACGQNNFNRKQREDMNNLKPRKPIQLQRPIREDSVYHAMQFAMGCGGALFGMTLNGIVERIDLIFKLTMVAIFLFFQFIFGMMYIVHKTDRHILPELFLWRVFGVAVQKPKRLQ